MAAIETYGLSKSFGRTKALDGVTFNVSEGEMFGIIGPDGAGKTTLFRLLTTLLAPDSGSARVLGYDTVADYRMIRSHIGYMPGRFSLYPDLSVSENLEFFAALFGVKVRENYDLIAPIYRQIEPFGKRRAGKLSGGMKQKLALCCALVHRPSVLFLDEPTTGVDAVSRSEFWDMLASLKAAGMVDTRIDPIHGRSTPLRPHCLMRQGAHSVHGLAPGHSLTFRRTALYPVGQRHVRAAQSRTRFTRCRRMLSIRVGAPPDRRQRFRCRPVYRMACRTWIPRHRAAPCRSRHRRRIHKTHAP